MIIVKKNPSYTGGTPYVALCKEVRRTDKRVYVEIVGGERWAVDGNGSNLYADIATVLTFDATESMFAEVQDVLKGYAQQQDSIRKMAVAAREAFDSALLEITSNVVTE
jgi:hypothetical protein